MKWKDYIHTDPKILAGKPVVKDTRLSVDFILDLFSNGWTERQVLENYPQLTKESLQAVFAYVQEHGQDAHARLDRTKFKAQTFQQADDQLEFWLEKKPVERLSAATYLNSVAWGFDMHTPPQMDKHRFSARHHAI